MSTMLNWNWSSQHVQSEVTSSEYLSGEHTLLMAGPPRLSQIQAGSNVGGAQSLNDIEDGANILFPIGLMANFSMNQNRNLRTIFEIGSIRRYMIAEKIINQLQMSRIKFYGPSLLRVLYAYYPNSKIPGSGQFSMALKDDQIDVPAANGDSAPGYGSSTATPVGANFANVNDTENNRDFWINLSSIVFRQPFGLGMYFKANNNRPYGASYLEECMIGSHAFSVNSDVIVMQEAIDAQFDRVLPIQVARPA